MVRSHLRVIAKEDICLHLSIEKIFPQNVINTVREYNQNSKWSSLQEKKKDQTQVFLKLDV